MLWMNSPRYPELAHTDVTRLHIHPVFPQHVSLPFVLSKSIGLSSCANAIHLLGELLSGGYLFPVGAGIDCGTEIYN